jgi:SAM-dependent methyltransferase
MAHFASQKFKRILVHNNLRNVRRVPDVGCGPGADALRFIDMEYLGVDQNESYVSDARHRHGRRFEAGDVTRLEVPTDQRFDFILVNSLLLHLDTPSTRRLFAHLPNLLSDCGHVHVIEVMPSRSHRWHVFWCAPTAATSHGRFTNGRGYSPNTSKRSYSSRSTCAQAESCCQIWSISRGVPRTGFANAAIAS